MITCLVIDVDEVVELPEVRFRIDLQNVSFAEVDPAPIGLKWEETIRHTLLQWLLIGGRGTLGGSWVRQDESHPLWDCRNP